MSYEVCEHGGMKRKCDVCSLQADVKELEDKLNRYQKALETIRDGFWSDGETDEEKMADIQSLAREALGSA